MRFKWVLSCALSILAVSTVRAQKPDIAPTFTTSDGYQWVTGKIAKFSSAGGATAVKLTDESILLSGLNPPTDTYTVVVPCPVGATALRIEALTHPSLGGKGPGRTQHGNFVLSEVTATAYLKKQTLVPGQNAAPGTNFPVKFTGARADFAQPGLPPANAIDGNPATGWAIHGRGEWNVNRALTLTFNPPPKPGLIPQPVEWTIKLVQQYGDRHTLGRFRIQFGTAAANPPPPALATGNWDFETGLQGWKVGPQTAQTAGIPAFVQTLTDAGFIQTMQARFNNNLSYVMSILPDKGHQGTAWVSSRYFPGIPDLHEAIRGALTSPDFRIDKRVVSWLVSGGSDPNNLRVELQVKWTDEADKNKLIEAIHAERVAVQRQQLPVGIIPPEQINQILATIPRPSTDGQYIVGWRSSGTGDDVMARVGFQVPLAQGRIARYKVIDYSHTGHITVDDFRVTDTMPVNLVQTAKTDPVNPPAANASTAKMTDFNPAKHGFRFNNSFTNTLFGPPISLTSGGLCGGMSYTSLDYYLAKIEPPIQDYKPAHRTTLQAYLYARQVISLEQNVDKWIEYNVNPGGSRNVEFFNWGVNERLKELKSFIDRGMPVPLGLEAIADSDHQVLAIGYDIGGYAGDLKDYKGEVKIFLCEPNYPGQTITMVANRDKSEFYYLEHPTAKKWRSYFVDGKYFKMSPPALPTPTYPNDGLIHELQLVFFMGNDGLEGGANQVNLQLAFSGDGAAQSYDNISQGGRWLAGDIETAQVILRTPKPQGSLRVLHVTLNKPAQNIDWFWKVGKVWINTVVGNGKPGGEVRTIYKYEPKDPVTFTDLRLPMSIFIPAQ